jgi:hypothetical protein
MNRMNRMNLIYNASDTQTFQSYLLVTYKYNLAFGREVGVAGLNPIDSHTEGQSTINCLKEKVHNKQQVRVWFV